MTRVNAYVLFNVIRLSRRLLYNKLLFKGQAQDNADIYGSYSGQINKEIAYLVNLST